MVEQRMRPSLHNAHAPTEFIPAVEQYFAEHGSLPSGAWCGVMHQAWEADTPGVHNMKECLRDPVFLRGLASCKGIITLTAFGAAKLRSVMPSDLFVPVTALKYPLPLPDSCQTSNTRIRLQQKKLVMIGSYMRDYQSFFKASVPDGWEKLLRTSAEVELPDGVQLLGGLSSGAYEELLSKSVVFMSMAVDGVANTVVVECILRSTPLVICRSHSAEEYLGVDYPLFFSDPADVQRLLQQAPLVAAVSYLRALDKRAFGIEGFLESFVSAPFYRALPCVEDQMHHNDMLVLPDLRFKNPCLKVMKA